MSYSTHTMLDDPDISKPSSSGSSDTLMIVSLPTPPYRTGVLQNVLLHCMPHSTSIASDAPKRKNTWHSRVSADARGGEEQAGGARHDMRRRVTPIYDDASRRASVGSKQVKV